MAVKSFISSIKNVLRHKSENISIEPTMEYFEHSYCGLNCNSCDKYTSNNCPGCVYQSKTIQCPIYLCNTDKGSISCQQCSMVDACEKRNISMAGCIQHIHEGAIIDNGVCYLINETEIKMAHDIFVLQASHGIRCLWFTKMLPRDARSLYDLRKTPVICLTEKTIADEYCINPKDHDKIFDAIDQYVTKAPGST